MNKDKKNPKVKIMDNTFFKFIAKWSDTKGFTFSNKFNQILRTIQRSHSIYHDFQASHPLPSRKLECVEASSR